MTTKEQPLTRPTEPLDWALHHGAEVLLPPDLYRTSGAGRNWVPA